MSETPQNLAPGRTGDATAKTVRELSCREIESLAVLHACGELDAETRAQLDAHVAVCSSCAAVVSREARLQQIFTSFEPPADSLGRSGLLLAQCRSELAEALDDRQASSTRSAWPAILSPSAWWAALRHTLIYHPAMSMATLLVAGFLAGVAGQRLPVAPPLVVVARPPAVTAVATPAASAPAPSTPSGPPKVTDEQLRSAANAHVTWVTPPGSRTPTVQIDLMSQNPMNIVGAPDDADVQRALMFLLQSGQRFDPDVRLDSLDVLRMNAADSDVRRALCATARVDRNPAVRRKALDALQGFERDPMVRDALLDALESDADPNVRVESIHLLLSALQSNGGSASDPQTVAVLRDRLRDDPSATVRRHSAAALQQLGEPIQ